MRRLGALLWSATILLILADRISKSWVLQSHSLPVELVEGFLSLVRVTNTGIAFGLFSRVSPSIMNPVLTTIGLAVCTGIGYMLIRREEPTGVRVAMHLLLAGAAGNIWDRLLYGHVVDFIDVSIRGHHWPSFNVADSCITIGLVLMVITSLSSGGKPDASESD